MRAYKLADLQAILLRRSQKKRNTRNSCQIEKQKLTQMHAHTHSFAHALPRRSPTPHAKQQQQKQ